MKTAESPSNAIVIGAALLLGGSGLVLLAHAVPLIMGDQRQSAMGVKLAGVAFALIGGGFDPINTLWLFLWSWVPFTCKKVVSPTKYARFGVAFSLVGLALIIAGFIGGWLVGSNKGAF